MEGGRRRGGPASHAAVAEAVRARPAEPLRTREQRCRDRRLRRCGGGDARGRRRAAAGVALVAGVGLERSGNALADAWGINGVVFGATILAAVTALPEISTGIRAVRLGRVGLAMGDIFGGNQVQMTLFLMADILAGRPVLLQATTSSLGKGGIGIVVTAVYALGLVVRPPRKVLRLGIDSWLVLVFYLFGIAGLVRI